MLVSATAAGLERDPRGLCWRLEEAEEAEEAEEVEKVRGWGGGENWTGPDWQEWPGGRGSPGPP